MKLIAYIYIHFSLSLDEKLSRKQIENLHTVCVEKAERRRRRHDVYNVQSHW